MNQKYVTSLELSQTLEKLGVKQISEFYWVKHEQWKDTKKGMRKAKPIYKLEQWGKITAYDHCSAFLSGELGEMLPDWFSIIKDKDGWYINAENIPKEKYISTFNYQTAKNLAEAMGVMLQYLIENNLIEI